MADNLVWSRCTGVRSATSLSAVEQPEVTKNSKFSYTSILKSLMSLCLPIGLYQLGVHTSANINNILLDIDLIWIFGMTKIKKTRGPASNGALWNNYKRGTLCPRKNSVTSCESFLIRICFLLLLYSLLGYRLLNCLPKNVRQVA